MSGRPHDHDAPALPPAPIDWRIEADDVPRGGLQETRSAPPEARAEIARLLGLLELSRLDLSMTLKPRAGDRFRLTGVVSADLTQACVVTLEPVAAHIEEPIDLELWPAHTLDGTGPSAHEIDVEGPDAPEPIMDGIIDLGRIAFELLAAAIDPYPRAPGATLEIKQSQEADDGNAPGRPFAALARLKGKESGSGS